MTAATAPWCPSGTTAPARLRLVPPSSLAPAPQGRTSATLRLSRRGRLTVTLMVSAVLIVVALSAVPASGIGAEIEHTMTVRSGQTLSGIAAAQLPELPLTQAVARIQIANGLNSVHIQAGQTLLIPSMP